MVGAGERAGRRRYYPGEVESPSEVQARISVLRRRMAPLYTRGPPTAQKSVRRPIVQLLRPSLRLALTCDRLEPLRSGHSSHTVPHLCPFFAQKGFVALGRASACRHRQRPDPPQHLAEEPPVQMPFRQQEPVVPRMLHQRPPVFTSRCFRLVSDQRLIRGDRTSLRQRLPNVGQDAQLQAHMWYNLAASRSTGETREEAVRGRDIVAGRMPPDDLSEAQRLARAWDSAHPR